MADQPIINPQDRTGLVQILKRAKSGYERKIKQDPAHIVNPDLTLAEIRDQATGLWVKFKPIVDELGAIHTGEFIDHIHRFADEKTNDLAIPTGTAEAIDDFLRSLPYSKMDFGLWEEGEGSQKSLLTLPRNTVHGAYKKSFSSFADLADQWRRAKQSIIRNREVRQNVKNPDALFGYERGVIEARDSLYHHELQNRIRQIAGETEKYIIGKVAARLEPYRGLFDNMSNAEAIDKAIDIAEVVHDDGVTAFHQLLENMGKNQKPTGHEFLSMAELCLSKHGKKPDSVIREAPSLPAPAEMPTGEKVKDLLTTAKERRAIRNGSPDIIARANGHRDFARKTKSNAAQPDSVKATKRNARQTKEKFGVPTSVRRTKKMAREVTSRASRTPTLVS